MTSAPATGRVIWITGLSGAGKTTLANALLPLLPEPRLLLDGDAMRAALAALASGYDPQSRKNLAYTYARLCGLLAKQGITVVCATISMFHEVRAWNRNNLPGYFEVYLEAAEDLRKARDYKNVYAIEDNKDYCASPVVGREWEPELPEHSDLVLCQKKRQTPEILAQKIAQCIE